MIYSPESAPVNFLLIIYSIAHLHEAEISKLEYSKSEMRMQLFVTHNIHMDSIKKKKKAASGNILMHYGGVYIKAMSLDFKSQEQKVLISCCRSS